MDTVFLDLLNTTSCQQEAMVATVTILRFSLPHIFLLLCSRSKIQPHSRTRAHTSMLLQQEQTLHAFKGSRSTPRKCDHNHPKVIKGSQDTLKLTTQWLASTTKQCKLKLVLSLFVPVLKLHSDSVASIIFSHMNCILHNTFIPKVDCLT